MNSSDELDRLLRGPVSPGDAALAQALSGMQRSATGAQPPASVALAAFLADPPQPSFPAAAQAPPARRPGRRRATTFLVGLGVSLSQLGLGAKIALAATVVAVGAVGAAVPVARVLTPPVEAPAGPQGGLSGVEQPDRAHEGEHQGAFPGASVDVPVGGASPVTQPPADVAPSASTPAAGVDGRDDREHEDEDRRGRGGDDDRDGAESDEDAGDTEDDRDDEGDDAREGTTAEGEDESPEEKTDEAEPHLDEADDD